MAPDQQEPHGPGYGNDSWMGIGVYPQTGSHSNVTPVNEFRGFDFQRSAVPLEPSFTMPRPPPYAASHPQMPPPLIMPHNAVWPSMLATQPTYPTPILPAAPVQTPVSASSASDLTPTSATKSSSRRKLTDDERRQMCLEAEQNPNMKQTQIGAKFNVERSTVSKILRQKDKYMNPQPKEESTSPGRRSKAKQPDFEKTLANWARNQQRKGLPVSDDELRKQAVVFSFSRNDRALLSSSEWLDKFKERNQLSPGSRGKKTTDSSTNSHTDTPIDGSPESSNGLVSPPMSAIDDYPRAATVKGDGADDFFDFDTRDFDDDLMHHDELPELPEEILSPISPEIAGGDNLSLHDLPDDSLVRQRRQTFSHTNASIVTRPAKPLPVRSATTSSDPRSTSVDPRQTMKRHKSVPDIHDTETVRYSSMQPPPLPRSADMSPVSDASSPLQDDNIRALHEIKKLLQQNPEVAEPDDYVMIGKLMEKMKVLRSPSLSSSLPGGMHAMEIADSPRLSKKRTIVGISS